MVAASILSIGTELTRGELVNTNASWLAAQLTDVGFEVVAIDTVDDDEGRIIEALRRLGGRSRVILCTGGLGPTTDDLTTATVAKLLGRSLVRHEPSFEAMRRRLEKQGREVSESNAKQVEVPEGADVLLNSAGAAPGYAVGVGEAMAFFMPGVPREVAAIFDEHVLPRLRAMAEKSSFQIKLKTFGLPESLVGDRLSGLEASHPGLVIGYRASFPEVEVKILVRGADEQQARHVAHAAADEARTRLGEHVYGVGDDTLPEAAARAVRARGWLLSLAESCTGGLIGHLLTSFPVSEFFVADAVTYANSAKATLAGVSEDIIRAHGAVSDEVAVAMAEGIKRACGVDVALAVTGLAGPTGGTPEKPVGHVCWAVSFPGGTRVQHRVLHGDRKQIQMMAAYVGLWMLRQVALEDERRTPAAPRAVEG